MKKIFLLIIVFFAFTFYGCSSKFNIKNVEENISDKRDVIFSANTNKFFVTLSSGEREEEYKYDGFHTNNIPFALLTFHFNDKLITEKIPFNIKINEEMTSGNLEKSPFSKEYLADLKQKISKEDKIILIIDNQETELICISKNWKIQSKDAIKIGIKSLSNEIKKNANDCEYYIKIIYDQHISKNTYYWLFSCVFKGNKFLNVVIDTNNEEVLFKAV